MNGNLFVTEAKNGRRSNGWQLIITTGSKRKRHAFGDRHRTGICDRLARSVPAIGRRKSVLELHHASRRPDRCRAQRAWRYPRHRDLASALLHDGGGLGGAIRCANIFAHCRSRVGDAQESAHPILGRNNAFVVGWSDTDQLRRTFRGRRGVALARRCKRQRRIAHRRHHSSRARSPLCELDAKLSEPDSAGRVVESERSLRCKSGGAPFSRTVPPRLQFLNVQ